MLVRLCDCKECHREATRAIALPSICMIGYDSHGQRKEDETVFGERIIRFDLCPIHFNSITDYITDFIKG